MIHLNRNLTEISILGSATQSPLIMDFLLICLCLDFGIFCHVGLFPLHLRPELLSKDTSANWYPLDIVSAFLLHPRSSELWLLLTFLHHIDSLPWFSLPNFSARLVSDLSLPDCQIPSLIHSYFSLSRPVIRSLGRHFPTYILCPFPFLPELCSLMLLSLLCLVLKTFSSMFPGPHRGCWLGKHSCGKRVSMLLF